MMFSLAAYTLHLLWLAWAVQALFGFRNAFMFYRRERRYQRRGEAFDLFTPPAAVIIPVKGADDRLAEHVEGLLNLDYPQYHLIFAVETHADPAYLAIAALVAGPDCPDADEQTDVLRLPVPTGGRAATGLTDIAIVVAGLSHNEAQKIHNQLAALKHLQEQDEVIVFADADAAMDRDWLVRLISPLRKQSIGLTTAWRWLLPADGRRSNLATHFACIINASIVTLQGRNRFNHAWGGSMAVRRQTLDQVQMPKPWLGTYNDDVTLSTAVAAIGQRVYLVPNMPVRSAATFTWASLLEFGRRQYLHARTYAPIVWSVGSLSTSLYMAGFFSAIITIIMQTRGWGWALITLAIVYALDIGRAAARKAIAELLFDDDSLKKLHGVWILERFFTPVWMLAHWIISCSSVIGNRFEWGGVLYQIAGPKGTRVLKRKTHSQPK
jgi:cellulose synthase/poly-beta-1,6-N-acetylglucosamine synthase-like glycosyltransferase